MTEIYGYGELRVHYRGEFENITGTMLEPTKLNLEIKFNKIVASTTDTYVLAIDTNENLWGWGDNSNGQLGNGTTTDSKIPIQIMSGTKFEEISVGSFHSMAIDKAGNLWYWGGSDFTDGAVGYPETDIKTPTKIITNKKFTKIAAGDYHSMAIDTEGNLWTWGNNYDGQLGNGSKITNNTPTKIMEGTKFKEIAAGKIHSMAIDSTGNLWTWGYGADSRLGYYTGENSYPNPTKEKTGTKFEYVSADSISFAIATGGNIWSAAGNDKNRGDADENSNTYWNIRTKKPSFVKVAMNSSTSVAIDTNGNLWGTGENGYNGTGKEHDYNYTKNWVQLSIKSSYIVTFKNGTETVKTEEVEEGKSATAPTLTKAGYTLKWDKQFTNITEDITVNAVWTANTNTAYKVQHYKQNTSLNGYTLAETENKTGTTDTTATAEAKTYTGFTENTNYSERVATGTINGNGTLVLKLYYDRNTYRINYELNGGNASSGNVENYVYGVEKALPTNITKAGYTFSGWYDNEQFQGNTITKILATETGDKTYYAKWTQNTYTVTFKDGTKEETQTVNHGRPATPPNWTKPGYTPSWDKDISNITSDITVNVEWIPNEDTEYKVEHYLRSTDLEVESYILEETENKTGRTDTTATAEAKTYPGFTENTNYSERVATGTINGNGTLVLKLYYDRNTYRINYELNGGTATNLSNSYIYGQEITLSNRVTKPGCVFLGWYNNEQLTGEAIQKITNSDIGDKTFYAKWSTEEEYYITSSEYSIDTENNYITKVSPNTKVTTFINNITTNGTKKVVNARGEEVNSENLVGTGYKLQVTYKGTIYEYEIAVRGDIDGNGRITVTDLSMINQAIVKSLTLTGIKEKAADTDYNGRITVTDLSMINQAITGKIEL